MLLPSNYLVNNLRNYTVLLYNYLIITELRPFFLLSCDVKGFHKFFWHFKERKHLKQREALWFVYFRGISNV